MGQFQSRQLTLTTEATEITENTPVIGLGVLGVPGGWRQNDRRQSRLQKCEAPLRRLGFLTLLVLLLGGVRASAQDAGKLVSAQGSVERQQPPWVPIAINTWLPVGTTIRTGADGRAVLLLVDETQLKINSNTELQLTGVRSATTLFKRVALSANRSQESVLSVAQGQVWVRARNTPADVKVTTPAVTAAIRGTEFDLRVAADGESVLTVLEGSVDF